MIMDTKEVCPSCGKPLAPNAPKGLCPACLLEAGFPSGTQADAGSVSKPGAFTPPTPEELAPHFPQLEILQLLGKGGMGAVYKARQKGLERIVALKVLPSEAGRDSAFAERFAREARALAYLSHANIVAVYDSGQAGVFVYLLMEFVDGVNLRQMLNAHRLSSREAMAIVPQVCEALQYAHDHGIVHRDIKPENVLVDKQGRAKIADFGLAKLLGKEPPGERLTRSAEVMGTPQYMAPEQLERPLEVDHRADIYSLGVVFYEMLTGELPLGRFAAPSKKVQIDVRLDEIVLRALEKEPDLRYQQASALKTEVETVVQTGQSKAKDSEGVRPSMPGAANASMAPELRVPIHRRLIQALARPPIAAVAAFLVCVVWAVILTIAIPVTWQASARIEVSDAEINMPRGDDIQTNMKNILSERVLSEVASSLDLRRRWKKEDGSDLGEQEAITLLRRGLSVQSIPLTRLVNIRFSHSSPLEAVQIADRIAEAYVSLRQRFGARIVHMALLPAYPSRPPAGSILVIGGAMGILLGFVLRLLALRIARLNPAQKQSDSGDESGWHGARRLARVIYGGVAILLLVIGPAWILGLAHIYDEELGGSWPLQQEQLFASNSPPPGDGGNAILVTTDDTGTYSSIQSAIDAAPPQATIRIGAGRFDENLVITKRLTLVGAGWDKTIIGAAQPPATPSKEEEAEWKRRFEQAGSPAERESARNEFASKFLPPAIWIRQADGVNLQNIRITQAGPVEAGRRSERVTVEISAAKVVIEGSAIVGAPGKGIRIANGSDVQIRSTLVAAVWHTGVSIDGGPSRVVVEDSEFRNCHYAGLQIGRGQTNVTVTRCRISGAAWHGVRYDNASPAIATNLIFGNARSGIYASGQTAAKVRGNLFHQNEMNGISCWFENADVIEQNTFVENRREALAVLGMSSPTIRSNIFSGHPAALHQGKIGEQGASAQDFGKPKVEFNLFWNNRTNWAGFAEVGTDGKIGAEQTSLNERTRSLEADPQFKNPHLRDYALQSNSPARRGGFGVAEPLKFTTPWPLQPEELAIIPSGHTRDSRQWKVPKP
jgi:predicted Ser/Thr protein kinase/capsular polysaccharide biosynthesis protein